MSESNHPHIDTLRYMVNSVYDNIRMYMPELNDEYYLPHVTELEDDEYEEGPGYNDPDEYFSDD